MTSRTPNDTRLKVEARATAVEVGSALVGGEATSLTVGQLDLSGSLANSSQARASLAAVSGATSSGGRSNGAAVAVDAPHTNVLTLDAGSGGVGAGCSESCWGATALPPFVVASDDGLPRAGVSGLPGLLNPVQTTLPDNVTRDGFQFRGAVPALPGLSQTLVSLDATPPAGDLVSGLADGLFHCAFSLVGPASHVTASGYLNSTDELNVLAPLRAEACGGARTNVIRMLPTATAPDGLIRLSLKSSARCTVSGAAHVPTVSTDYRAEVEYWRWTPSLLNVLGIVILPGHGEYVSAGTITPATTADPLAAIPLSTPVSDTETLGTYIDSWTGLTNDRVTAVAAGHVAEVTVPALVTVTTQPIAGPGEPQTTMSFAAGAASCRAEDNR
jgi:hypothetical protein